MKCLYFVLVAVCVFYTSSAEDAVPYTDLRQVLANQPKEDRNCTAPGLLCTNCTRLVNCIQGEDDTFEEVLVQTCGSDQSCMTNHCTSDTNPNCIKDYKFDCTATGVFPDPFNCRKFHYCVVEQSDSNNIEIEVGAIGVTSLLCDEDHAYDPVTTYCKKNLTAIGCPQHSYPVPICLTAGQSGPLSNKSIYYVCVNTGSHLIPKLYVCPHGKTYNNSRCA